MRLPSAPSPPWFDFVVVMDHPAALKLYADDAGVFPGDEGATLDATRQPFYARLVCIDPHDVDARIGDPPEWSRAVVLAAHLRAFDGRGWQRGQGEPAWRYFDTLWSREKWEVDYAFAVWEVWRNHPGVRGRRRCWCTTAKPTGCFASSGARYSSGPCPASTVLDGMA